MNDILFATLLVTGIGLIASAGLVLAQKFMSVPEDETAVEIEKILPGANCGACGFSGCAGYAAAISQQGAKTNMCSVGGDEVAKAIAEYLGVEAEAAAKTVSCVMCRGSYDCAARKADYHGITSCKSAFALFGGVTECKYGCIGLGDCARACEFGGITLKNGVAEIEAATCVACGKCIDACPKNLISLVPADSTPVVKCSSKDAGGITRKACTAGCIGCKMCQKTCEQGAITVTDNLATVDFEKCIGCGKCLSVCKPGCLTTLFDCQKNN